MNFFTSPNSKYNVWIPTRRIAAIVGIVNLHTHSCIIPWFVKVKHTGLDWLCKHSKRSEAVEILFEKICVLNWSFSLATVVNSTWQKRKGIPAKPGPLWDPRKTGKAGP